MENKLTIKDSSLAFFTGFLLCQLGVVVATCIITLFFSFTKLDLEMLQPFLNTAIGYLLCSFSMDVVMLAVFFFFNKKKDNRIFQKPSFKKVLIYIGIAVLSFLMLYPLIVCIDSLLIHWGVKLNTLPYELNTTNYIISLFSIVIAPAVCEEFLFRGLIFKGLQKYGKTFSIITSSIMFCLFHMAISQTIYPLIMGLLLSLVMYRENNLLYCIIIHTTNNFISLTLSYLNINLIFNHWTYILMAIALAIIFITTLVIFIVKTKISQEKSPILKKDAIYLITSLTIMLIIWILYNTL